MRECRCAAGEMVTIAHFTCGGQRQQAILIEVKTRYRLLRTYIWRAPSSFGANECEPGPESCLQALPTVSSSSYLSCSTSALPLSIIPYVENWHEAINFFFTFQEMHNFLDKNSYICILLNLIYIIDYIFFSLQPSIIYIHNLGSSTVYTVTKQVAVNSVIDACYKYDFF